MSRSPVRPAPARAAALLAAAMLTACEPAPAVTSTTNDRPPATAATPGAPGVAQWRVLARARVLFGHQSVGGNLMDGVDALLREAPPTSVKVVAADSTAVGKEPPAPGAITHFYIGENGNPASKLAAFAQALDRAGTDLDVAMMKFCYLDMRADSDPDALFRDYQRTMATVRERHPGLTLVHVTMPVTTVEGGAKAMLKSAMGKATSRELNRRRERYNALLRQAYEGREPVFDLARLESTGVDGRAHTVSVKGEAVPVLAPEYTDDGGHLNARGQRAVGARLVESLARAAGARP